MDKATSLCWMLSLAEGHSLYPYYLVLPSIYLLHLTLTHAWVLHMSTHSNWDIDILSSLCSTPWWWMEGPIEQASQQAKHNFREAMGWDGACTRQLDKSYTTNACYVTLITCSACIITNLHKAYPVSLSHQADKFSSPLIEGESQLSPKKGKGPSEKKNRETAQIFPSHLSRK